MKKGEQTVLSTNEPHDTQGFSFYVTAVISTILIMVFITLDKVRALTKKAVSLAKKQQNKGCFDYALDYYEVAAYTKYYFYQDVKDKEIEDGIQSISSFIKKRENEPLSKSKRCVFFDTHSAAKGGLTQQYLRALFSMDVDLLYMTEVSSNSLSFQPINHELKEAGARVLFIPPNIGGFKKAQYIYDAIMDYSPQWLLSHCAPRFVHPYVAFASLPDTIKKYRINFTDHTYWPGYSVIDRVFEFRPYGSYLSIKERGIPIDKDYLIPFYPIEDDAPFEGYPFDSKGKIVVFSGGAYYKTADKNNTFIKLCKKLIDISPDIMIVYAGIGNDQILRDGIKNYELEDRMFLVGHRKDLSAVFDNCVLYLDTYPVKGGLMCQFAARHAVPILSLYAKDKSQAEEFVCQTGYYSFTSKDMDELINKATTLLGSIDMRASEGLKLKDLCISVDQFNQAVSDALLKDTKLFKIEVPSDFTPKKFDAETKAINVNKTKDYQLSVVNSLGYRILWLKPLYVLDAIGYLIKHGRFIKTIMKRIKIIR